jgi:hypothetical protein
MSLPYSCSCGGFHDRNAHSKWNLCAPLQTDKAGLKYKKKAMYVLKIAAAKLDNNSIKKLVSQSSAMCLLKKWRSMSARKRIR